MNNIYIDVVCHTNIVHLWTVLLYLQTNSTVFDCIDIATLVYYSILLLNKSIIIDNRLCRLTVLETWCKITPTVDELLQLQKSV